MKKNGKNNLITNVTKNYDIITSGGQIMCLIWNLIKAFTDTEDDNKKDNNDLEDWQKELVKEKKYNTFNFEEEELEDDDYYSEDDNE